MRSIAIVGAGIAGLALAWRLARAGFSVCIYERGAAVLSGASGVPAALIHAPHATEHDLDGQLAREGLRLGLRAFNEIASRGVHAGFVVCAVLELRQRRNLDHLHQHAGWLRPKIFADALMTDAGAAMKVRTHSEVRQLQAVAGGWKLTLASAEQVEHDALVLCCAGAAAQLVPVLAPCLQAVSGQCERWAGLLPKLEHAWAGDLSIIPLTTEQWLVGASYLRGVQQARCAATTAKLYAQASQLLAPAVIHVAAQSSWFGTRWVSPDRRALVGSAPQAGVFQRDGWPTPVPRLLLNLAHGSRGFTGTFLAAELLCEKLSGSVCTLPSRLEKALDPRRFSRR